MIQGGILKGFWQDKQNERLQSQEHVANSLPPGKERESQIREEEAKLAPSCSFAVWDQKHATF